uniref:Uncharacterized protein n=1 Tax=Arabidopsis thaliana TaxID=3702 RepID=Q0WN91_ARATH|nr:hypothetical protein [Arabidopsis thaliana]
MPYKLRNIRKMSNRYLQRKTFSL